MLPRFISSWLGYSTSMPTPLWRHPEVSFIDWLIQLLFPLILPLRKIAAAAAVGDDGPLKTTRASMNKQDGSVHDQRFSGWRVTQIEAPGRDGTILIHLHTPPRSQQQQQQQQCDRLLPLVLWFHGGGYTISSARDSYGASFATELLALGARVAWASVEYRLAPEHAFPAAAHDALDALEYFTTEEGAARAAAEWGVDSSRIHIAGTSAGAGLAIATAAAAARNGNRSVRSLLADEPMLDHTCLLYTSPSPRDS